MSPGGKAFCVGQGGARNAGGGHEAERFAAQAHGGELNVARIKFQYMLFN